ncbi:hypothetical protein BH23ACT9_BH23ACT9_10320 [soil metagenome]
MVATPHAALARLRGMAAAGELAVICAEHDLDLLVVHGSVLHDDGQAADLDVAVWPTRGGRYDHQVFGAALSQALKLGRVDLMDLSRAGVVARGLALGRCEPLYERLDGVFARRQMAALPPLADTTWIRDLGLRTMAGR